MPHGKRKEALSATSGKVLENRKFQAFTVIGGWNKNSRSPKSKSLYLNFYCRVKLSEDFNIVLQKHYSNGAASYILQHGQTVR